jgi:transketolase
MINGSIVLTLVCSSIGLGEDGPTHQPIETAAWLRAMPNLHLWRPADGNETSAAYFVALQARKTPSVLCLSRQNLPQLPNSSLAAAAKGGYVVREVPNGSITLVATGSEVSIALDAASVLEKDGVGARVVSLPCWEVFKQQSPEYQLSVFRPGQAVLSVEAYSSFGEWPVHPTRCVANDAFRVEHILARARWDRRVGRFGAPGCPVQARESKNTPR